MENINNNGIRTIQVVGTYLLEKKVDLGVAVIIVTQENPTDIMQFYV